jgi:glycosyltransferase involved in cell wall biosynthesis
MRILLVGNTQIRRFGKARVSTEHKLHNGFIRNQHHVLHFSDRDMASFLAPFGWRDLGIGKMNRKLIQTAENFQPQLILLGHCDLISNQTLDTIRERVAEVKIAYRNVDPLFVPHNIEAIQRRVDSVDSIFITTAGDGLVPFRGKRATVHYIPNPTDASIETFDNSNQKDLPYDLFFCGNSNEHTSRRETIDLLYQEFKDSPVTFKTFGYYGEPNVWGHDYEAVLSKSKMGLNLNRQEDYLYSSARLSQLMANGILALIPRGSSIEKLIGEDNAVFYNNNQELVERIYALHQDDAERRKIAAAGRNFYRTHFSSELVAQYILERTSGLPFSNNYIWSDY